MTRAALVPDVVSLDLGEGFAGRLDRAGGGEDRGGAEGRAAVQAAKRRADGEVACRGGEQPVADHHSVSRHAPPASRVAARRISMAARQSGLILGQQSGPMPRSIETGSTSGRPQFAQNMSATRAAWSLPAWG
jgi:hypothetical protein